MANQKIAKTQYDSMIRVNHAGEYGAKRIYEGQIKILKNKKCYPLIQEMYEQELHHLSYFENLIKEKRVRPTALYPIWHNLGFALGAISALLGEKYAMACTAAVEDVIDRHYQEQQNILKEHDDERELLSNIEKFRNEEIEHRNIGEHYIEQTSHQNSMALKCFMLGIKTVTKIAISLSKRL